MSGGTGEARRTATNGVVGAARKEWSRGRGSGAHAGRPFRADGVSRDRPQIRRRPVGTGGVVVRAVSVQTSPGITRMQFGAAMVAVLLGR